LPILTVQICNAFGGRFHSLITGCERFIFSNARKNFQSIQNELTRKENIFLLFVMLKKCITGNAIKNGFWRKNDPDWKKKYRFQKNKYPFLKKLSL
jgi:hypothetical protein